MRRISIAATCALALLATTTALRAQPSVLPQFAAKLSPDELKIETALAKPVKLSYRAAPFKDVIADLSKQVDLPIALDPEGLDEAGVKDNQAVTLEMGTLGLRQGFELILSPLHLSFVPGAAGLTITSEESCAERPIVRVYPVGDLIRVKPRADGEVMFDFDTLIDTITSHLSPDSWTDNGGPSSIQAGPGSCLVISQSYVAQLEIDQLLTALRGLKTDHARLKSDESGPIISIADNKVIHEALQKRDSTTLDIELKFYVQDVAKVIKRPITIDPEGLEEAGVTAGTMVHVVYQDARIGDVFRETLAKHHLAYVVKEGYVVVTSEEKATEIGRHTRLYPVADLAPLRAVQDPPVRDFDALIDFITTSGTDPGQWADYGGQSSISAWVEPAALIVTTTDETHEEVQRLLTTIRESGVAEFNAEQQKADQRIVERIYPLYMARREKRAKAAKDKSTEEIPSADDVAKLIEELLPEVSWKEPGVLLRPFHDRLIVRHRPATLHKVEKLLQKIEAWPHMNAIPPPQHRGQGGMGGGFF